MEYNLLFLFSVLMGIHKNWNIAQLDIFFIGMLYIPNMENK